MKITNYKNESFDVKEKELKRGTILKDSDGYFIIKEHNKKMNWYHYVECDKNGIIMDENMDGVLSPSDLVGAEIIKF